MARISAKINLMNLRAQLRMMKGQEKDIECLIIPISANKLFKGEKGIYLDLVGFEIEKPIEGSKDTHLLKQSFNKEIRDQMTKDELMALPILGNLRIWEAGSDEPVSNMNVEAEESDLPF